MKRRSRARLLPIALAALAAALSPQHARAQAAHEQTAAESSSNAPTPGRPLVAEKIDEFGLARGCDHGARLDNFAIELQNFPDHVGYVIAYGVEGEASGAAGFRLKVTKDYLVNSRGIDEDRIVTLYGGPYRDKTETHAELWRVPPGAEVPKPVRYKNDAATFKGKFDEYDGWDEVVLSPYDAGTGPSVGDMTLAGFAEVLRLQPSAVAYVVTYHGREAAPGAWRRVGEREAESLRWEYGVDASRVGVLFGGYEKRTTVCLWVLPKDAPPPVRRDKKERRPLKAVKVIEAGRHPLRWEENERSVFRGFAEVLKGDAELNLCFVVRPDAPGVEEFDPDNPPDPEEPPDVDMVKLVEKWKARLSKEYGVGGHRVIVLVAVPSEDDWRAGRLEAWAVPPGAALPDPSAAEGESESGEENQ
ncbi:MAG TPA: hypothetical protein VKB12_15490 [Pyrinomonadaceae bacterium]|nr:hypothetical protein [Pyrinomonadaceae bacterium]